METTEITPKLASAYLSVPGEADHKYTRGTVELITGSARYPGAGVLSAGGACYGGAGVVRFSGSERSAELVLQQFPEVVLTGTSSDSLVIGCGWGEDLRARAEAAASAHGGPLVVDAGALLNPQLRPGNAAVTVLTPHPGEARRLWASLSLPGEYPSDAAQAASRMAEATGTVVILKAATTMVAGGGKALSYRARTAWPGVAGAGDVLAGVVGSVLARYWKLGGGDWVSAVAAAVWLHGEAGALAAGVGGDTTHPVRANDIIRWLPAAWDRLPR